MDTDLERRLAVERMGALLCGGALDGAIHEVALLLEHGSRRQVLEELIDAVGELPGPVRARDPDGGLQSVLGRALALSMAPPSEAERQTRDPAGSRPPPGGARAARVRELFRAVRAFALRRLLLDSGRARRDRAAVFALAKWTTALDRHLEGRPEDAEVRSLELEGTRPVALEAHQLAARRRPMVVDPLWPSRRESVDPNAVAFSGGRAVRAALEGACRRLGAELLGAPEGVDAADARWRQLGRARVVVGDLTSTDAAERAEVAYHLGIARAVGASVVVVVRPGGPVPLGLDVPVVLADEGGGDDLARAVDEAFYQVPPDDVEPSLEPTCAELRRRYADAADGELRLLVARLGAGAEPLQLDTVLAALRRALGARAPELIHPPWGGRYPDPARPRLFHAMPSGAAGSRGIAAAAERACEAVGWSCVRHDPVLDAETTWERICGASHVLVDLTGFDQDVAFQAGLAHTLGRDTLLVTRDPTGVQPFPSIRGLRVHRPDPADRAGDLQHLVAQWLAGIELPDLCRA